MSDIISITLNGKKVEVAPGTTLRTAAEAEGIHIPTFCHDDRLKPFASCFLCVVEVEKARGLLPACSTQATPGMVVQTDSQRVTETRKMALDLLLSDHAGDCIAPCEETCPANIDIQGYIAHIANGDSEAAVRLIKRSNPLPVVCGRICPHPCESQCRRGLVDEAVAINPLKRFASEYELLNGPFLPKVASDTGKSVAIVGGGPAGLTAAYYLRQKGHEVHLFEALPELGGMVRYGIPRFRLPWEFLDREIQSILDLGVHLHTNKRLGEDFTLPSLKQEGFQAILLAIGAHKAKPMRVPNEESAGVIGGIDFLRKIVLKEPVDLGKRVAVIGGGDTAMDCARVARRLGSEVILLYRRTQAEMPALPMEQEETMEEGVEFRFLTAPTEVILDNDGRASHLRVITMELGEPDASGRRRPVPIEGTEENLPFDLIISAIGQDPDLSCVQEDPEKPETTRWKTFVYDEQTNITSQEGIFAAGDCAFGPDTVIRAVGEGQRSAKAIDLYLSGANVTIRKPYAISRGRIEELDMADFSPRYPHKKRALETVFPADHRLKNGGWEAINQGLNSPQAMAEATRCIECGCNARFDCDLRTYSTLYHADEKRLAGDKRSYDEDQRHPLIRIEGDKCITCASCVRVCSEVREIYALAFINRGFGTRVGPNFDDALQTTDCDACGMCIDVCPTGAIAPNTGKEAGPWIDTVVHTTCTACSRGCGLAAHVAEGRIVKIRSIDGDSVNNACICAEGRFSYQLRLMDDQMDDQKPAILDDATLQNAQTMLSEAQQIAVIVSARLTAEQIYAAARLARNFGGTLHYRTADYIHGVGRPHGKLIGEANIALLKKLNATPWHENDDSVDLILLIGLSITRRSAGGARMLLITDTPLTDHFVDLQLTMADPLSTEGILLNRDGDAAALQPVLPTEHPEGHALIARLAGLKTLSSLDVLRQELADEITELSSLSHLSKKRLTKTDLTPLLQPITADLRESAFSNYVTHLGLSHV